ncbi:MAG: hypothetical protein Q9160_000836 [Pyrenula sp. 1 TL-2023]
MAAFAPQDLFGGAIVAELPVGWIDASDIRQIPDHQEVFLSPSTLTSMIIEINEYVSASTTQSPSGNHEPISAITAPSDQSDRTQNPAPQNPNADEDDQRAALYHLHDLISTSEDEEASSTRLKLSTPTPVPVTLGNTDLAKQARAWQIAARVSSPAPFPLPDPFPPPQTMEEALTGTRAAPPNQAQTNNPTMETTTLHLLLIRLPAQQTDLCIQVNVPWKELQPAATADSTAPRGGDRVVEEAVRQEEALGSQILARVARTVEVREWGLFG